jgi:hypothetical protein
VTEYIQAFAVSAALSVGAEIAVSSTVRDDYPYRSVTVAFLADDNAAGQREYVAYWETQSHADAASTVPRDHVVRWAVCNATVPALGAGTATEQRGCGLGSRAFADGGYVYVHTVHDTTYWATYFLQRHDNAQVIARLLPGTAGGIVQRSHLPGVQEIESGERAYQWASIYYVQLEGEDGDQFTEAGIRRQTLDFDSDSSHQSAELGACVYVGGGMLHRYDGEGFTEAQPHYAPDGDWNVSQTTGGGGGLVAGTYSYIVVPEWVAATGERVRGPASVPVEVVVTGVNDQVEFDFPTIRHTACQSPRTNLSLGVYRTLDGDASIYYRCSSLEPPQAGASVGDNGYVENAPGEDTASFTDILSDANLALREPLYLTGGVLSNDPLPACSIVAAGKGRLFFSDPSNPHLVRYTQERAEGYTVEPAPDLQILVDQHGGAVTGLAVMDGALIVFKESAIYVVSGDGPAANPDLGGFSAPALITTDVGCSNADSIAVTPAGLVFQSAKGIYLLDTSRQTSYVGAPVERFNAQRVSRATLVEDAAQIRFLTDSGSTLLYDYLFGQWSTFTNHEGLDALVLGGTYRYLRTDGRVFVETPGEYRDDNSAIRLTIETAWIKFRDLIQGWQRVWHATVIGEYKSAHKLLVSWAKDYAPTFSTPYEINAGTLYAAATGYGEGAYNTGPYGGTGMESVGYAYQHKIHVGVHGQAIRFRFQDLEAFDAFGASVELTDLLLTGGVLRGSAVVSPSRMA